MKVSCLQENLAKGLAIASRAVATRSTLPVLSNILMATDEGRLKLSATNLEIGINCWIGAKVEEDGAITVPARLLTDFVNSLPPERIDMQLVTRTQTLSLKCANYEANIKGIDAQEFPLIVALSEDTGISLEPPILREMINQVSFAAALDESRPVLTGVLAELSGTRLTMAAADGFRLSVRYTELADPVPEPASVIIPARALQEVARISADEENPIRMIIAPHRSQVFFRMTNIDLVSQLVEGNFPDYKQIVPKSYITRTIVDTAEFLKAVKIASFFARDAANIIRLRIAPGEAGLGGQMTVMATSVELGDNLTELDAAVEGEPIEIAFNAKYLNEVLSVITKPQVALETSAPSSPGVIRPVGDETFVHVVMPMHIAR
ncbi:MAG: DNA polymerase III subunit beta [Chloroflexi bacterium]|nr:DNA polymerase III subunit beta [Chloroflexota bacterium]